MHGNVCDRGLRVAGEDDRRSDSVLQFANLSDHCLAVTNDRSGLELRIDDANVRRVLARAVVVVMVFRQVLVRL